MIMLDSLLLLISTALAIWLILRLANYLPTKWQQPTSNKTVTMVISALFYQPPIPWKGYHRVIAAMTTLLSLINVIIIGYQLPLIALLLFTWLLMIIAIIDYQHLMIPDELNYTLLWSGLLITLFPAIPSPSSQQAIVSATIGYLSLWGIGQLFLQLRKKPGMGHGDFKLVAALGAWTGWQSLAFIVFSSSLLALFYCAMVYYFTNKRSTQLPFAPFLAITGWAIVILQHCPSS